MKHCLIILLYVTIVNICCGQLPKNKLLFNSVCQPSKLQHVFFCGIKIKVPRPHTPNTMKSCCQGDSSKNSSNLTCENSGLLTWTYYPTEDSAKTVWRNYIDGLKRNNGILDIQRQEISCSILNKKVKGYRYKLKLTATTSTITSNKQTKVAKTTVIQYILTAVGVINKRPVIVELYAAN